MIPDLGKYQGAVLSAYAVSIFLLVALVLISVWRSRAIKRQLEAVEKRGSKSN